MSVLMAIFLLLFWGGVITLVLSLAHVILISPLAVFIVWLVIMGAYILGIVKFLKKLEQYENELRFDHSIDRAEAAAKMKIYQMEQEKALRNIEQ